jgi:Tfp pilus assembly protein PilX
VGIQLIGVMMMPVVIVTFVVVSCARLGADQGRALGQSSDSGNQPLLEGDAGRDEKVGIL